MQTIVSWVEFGAKAVRLFCGILGFWKFVDCAVFGTLGSMRSSDPFGQASLLVERVPKSAVWTFLPFNRDQTQTAEGPQTTIQLSPTLSL